MLNTVPIRSSEWTILRVAARAAVLLLVLSAAGKAQTLRDRSQTLGSVDRLALALFDPGALVASTSYRELTPALEDERRLALLVDAPLSLVLLHWSAESSGFVVHQVLPLPDEAGADGLVAVDWDGDGHDELAVLSSLEGRVLALAIDEEGLAFRVDALGTGRSFSSALRAGTDAAGGPQELWLGGGLLGEVTCLGLGLGGRLGRLSSFRLGESLVAWASMRGEHWVQTRTRLLRLRQGEQGLSREEVERGVLAPGLVRPGALSLRIGQLAGTDARQALRIDHENGFLTVFSPQPGGRIQVRGGAWPELRNSEGALLLDLDRDGREDLLVASADAGGYRAVTDLEAALRLGEAGRSVRLAAGADLGLPVGHALADEGSTWFWVRGGRAPAVGVARVDTAFAQKIAAQVRPRTVSTGIGRVGALGGNGDELRSGDVRPRATGSRSRGGAPAGVASLADRKAPVFREAPRLTRAAVSEAVARVPWPGLPEGRFAARTGRVDAFAASAADAPQGAVESGALLVESPRARSFDDLRPERSLRVLGPERWPREVLDCECGSAELLIRVVATGWGAHNDRLALSLKGAGELPLRRELATLLTSEGAETLREMSPGQVALLRLRIGADPALRALVGRSVRGEGRLVLQLEDDLAVDALEWRLDLAEQQLPRRAQIQRLPVQLKVESGASGPRVVRIGGVGVGAHAFLGGGVLPAFASELEGFHAEARFGLSEAHAAGASSWTQPFELAGALRGKELPRFLQALVVDADGGLRASGLLMLESPLARPLPARPVPTTGRLPSRLPVRSR